MNYPPPGYDDDSVVPQQRLKFLLGQFEDELGKVEKVFQQHLPGEFRAPPEIEREFWHLRHSAEELGGECTFLVNKLISDYENFNHEPEQAKLDQLFSDIKSLQLLLTG